MTVKMKALILSLTLLVSFSAFAGRVTKTETTYSTVNFSQIVPMNIVCIDGEEMRTKTMREVCIEFSI